MNGRGTPPERHRRIGAAGVLLALALTCATLTGATLTGAVLAAEPGGEALVTVMGVVSPGSSFGLLKHLGGIPGVAEVHFDLLHGLARVRLKPGATVSDEQLREAVLGASYTPGDIRWQPAQTATKGQ